MSNVQKVISDECVVAKILFKNVSTINFRKILLVLNYQVEILMAHVM